MSHFFQPNSKVQKDRQVMRDTDFRMAKYSRRGLILNFVASIFCILGGEFVHMASNLAIVLVAGLLLNTLLRGYFLFRFDQLYPRGPKRWRDKYFIITLLGAFWWGVILVCITSVLGMGGDTLLLWLYTVVFFSSTAHAFAPYHVFLKYYQFLGLIPAAAAAVVTGTQDGYIFGCLMLVFYLLLTHQCRLISDNYWEKLEAGYALGKRAIKDEQERISSRAKLLLSQEFLANLTQEISNTANNLQANAKASDLKNILSDIGENLSLYHNVLSNKLEINHSVFNIRHEIQFLVSEILPEAEAKKIQIETSLAPSLPMRLKGDAVLFGQVIQTLLKSMLDDAEALAVVLEVQFLREYESAGELHVTVRRVRNKKGIQFFSETITYHQPDSLALTMAKALAEALDGEVEILNEQVGEFYLQFNAKMEIADHVGQMDFHKDRFAGEKILLVGSNPTIVDIKRQELDALGFTTSVETVYKRVPQILKGQIASGSPIENILIYHEPENELCEQLLTNLRESDKLKFVNKLISASPQYQKQLIVSGLDASLGFYYVSKPTGLFELESTFDFILSSKGDETALSQLGAGTVLVIGDPQEIDAIADGCEGMHRQKVIRTTKAKLSAVLDEAHNPMAVIPCNEQQSASEIVKIIRDYEAVEKQGAGFIPIIGVGVGKNEREVAAFEIGLDDYIDLASQRSKTLTSMLRYWRSLDL